MKSIIYRLGRAIERLGSLIQGKGYEVSNFRAEVSALAKLLHTPPLTILDIGGNVGDWTAEARHRFPTARVFVIEPALVNVEKLEVRYKDDPHVSVHRVAFSKKKGQMPLFSDSPGSGLASLVHRDLSQFGIQSNITEFVDTDTIQAFVTSVGVEELGIVKMDIEGHELTVLRSAPNEFWEKVQAIQFEFGGANLDARSYLKDFWLFFKEHGFDLHRVTPFGFEPLLQYREQDETFRMTNYVAVNRAYSRGKT